jgi:hypothetical protein
MSTLEKDQYATPVALTITLASLASSAAGVGRQSTAIDNSTTQYPFGLVYFSIKLGTSPTAGLLTFYLLRRDTADSISDDAAGASDAGITLVAAPPIASYTTGASPTTGQVISGSFYVDQIGPNFALALVQSSGVALDATAANHKVTFAGGNPAFA